MAGWNGSGMRGNSTPVKPKVAAKKPSPVRGIVAGLVVVVAVIGCYFAFFSGSEKPQEEVVEKRPTKIKQVTPAAAPTNSAPVKKELTDEEKRQKEIARLEKIFEGREMPKGIKTRIYYLKNPPKSTYVVKVPHDYLEHHSERAIAGLVLAEPGTEFLDCPTYDARFNQDFQNSIIDKIVIKEDDSEEVRNVKQSVIDAKKEIVRICKEEGKKPNEVMNEYGKMMYDLGKFDKELRRELNEKRNDPSVSDEDLKDFFRAANKMREQRGLKPVSVPSFGYRGMMLSRRAERQKAAEAAAQQQNGNGN